mmetsp:Transcript_9440/g.26314  ORF Transcript_9440/g.26314 Transcript_9440/m.26314 type:complete len:250 (-) Transcript_9440:128-877(-)
MTHRLDEIEQGSCEHENDPPSEPVSNVRPMNTNHPRNHSERRAIIAKKPERQKEPPRDASAPRISQRDENCPASHTTRETNDEPASKLTSAWKSTPSTRVLQDKHDAHHHVRCHVQAEPCFNWPSSADGHTNDSHHVHQRDGSCGQVVSVEARVEERDPRPPVPRKHEVQHVIGHPSWTPRNEKHLLQHKDVDQVEQKLSHRLESHIIPNSKRWFHNHMWKCSINQFFRVGASAIPKNGGVGAYSVASR